MPTLNIGGKRVTVGDDFLQLPPDQQEATVNEIAQTMGAISGPTPLTQEDTEQFKPDTSNSYTGNTVPAKIDYDTGERSLAVPRLISGAASAAKDAAMLPGQVYSGEKQVGDLTPGDTLNFAAFASPVNPAYRVGDRAIPGVARRETTRAGPAPKTPALRDVSGKQFDAFRASGANVKVEAARGFTRVATAQLEKEGFLSPDAKSTYNVLKMLEGGPNSGYLSPAGIHSARKALGRIAGNYNNPTDQAAASRVIKMLDEFFETLPPQGFVDRAAAEQAGAAKQLFRDARGNWAAAERSDTLTGKVHAAELRAAAANSGRNLDNSIRQRLAGIAISPSQGRGFTKGEIGQVEGVVKGTKGMNAARIGGNLLGGGGGLGSVVSGAVGGMGAAAATGSPVGALLGAAAPATGWALKGLENRLARKAVGKVDEATRARSPLAANQPRVSTNPNQVPSVGGAALRAGAASQLNRADSRKESMAFANGVVGAEMMDHIKKTPHLRSQLHDWMVARHRKQDVEGVTSAFAQAIADEVGRPELAQRIADELNAARGAQ
jgi:hypothetical protein